MKQFIPFSAALAGIVALLCIGNSCSKSSDSSTPGSSNNTSGGTTAQAAYDSQSGGIYKGTLTGSSGYFVVNLQATKPYVIYQWTDPAGVTDSLPAASLNNWQTGQVISKALFTGPSGAKFWFSVGANGSNPTVDSAYFPGHNGPVYITIVKETSTNPVKIYQGTATGGPAPGSTATDCTNAILTVWTAGTMALITFADIGRNQSGTLNGTISGNQLQILADINNNEVGTLTISNDASSISGKVSGKSCAHTIALKRIF